MVILDTNIIIDHLRQSEKNDTELMKIARQMNKSELALSVISVQELYEGQSTKKRAEEEKLLATISPLKIFGYNFEIAQKAGKIARDLSNPIELADATIAATAIVNNAKVFTLNEKDFENIEGVELFELD